MSNVNINNLTGAQVQGVNKYISKVFGHLLIAIGLAAVSCYAAIRLGFLDLFIVQSSQGYSVSPAIWLTWVIPFAMIMFVNFKGMKYSTRTLSLMLYAIAITLGVGISVSVFLVNYIVVLQALGLTSLIFGGMWAFGYFTKINLSPIGSFLIMALWGLIGFGVISAIMGSSIGLWYSYGVALISAGLVAFTVQSMKRFYFEHGGKSEVANKLAIMFALSLFIDFVNIFLSILRILGSRD